MVKKSVAPIKDAIVVIRTLDLPSHSTYIVSLLMYRRYVTCFALCLTTGCEYVGDSYLLLLLLRSYVYCLAEVFFNMKWAVSDKLTAMVMKSINAS